MTTIPQMEKQTNPILLFNDECAVCRSIGGWVKKSAVKANRESASIVVRPIGDDPDELRSLNPELDIWDAYATIHVLMPDGSMKVGGEAVAEVLRDLRNTKWFAWIFAISIFGFRPFQLVLNVAYVILADVRPLFGCESCGKPSFWVRPIAPTIKWVKSIFGKKSCPEVRLRISLRSRPQELRTATASGETYSTSTSLLTPGVSTERTWGV
jgi:predicted DCC family thiol-disulfide oxidoreductase YuxK